MNVLWEETFKWILDFMMKTAEQCTNLFLTFIFCYFSTFHYKQNTFFIFPFFSAFLQIPFLQIPNAWFVTIWFNSFCTPATSNWFGTGINFLTQVQLRHWIFIFIFIFNFSSEYGINGFWFWWFSFFMFTFPSFFYCLKLHITTRQNCAKNLHNH